MTDAFEEVNESLRQDRATELWKTYAPWLAGAAVALILAVAGYQAVAALHNQQVETDAQSFGKAMDAVNKKDMAGARAILTKLTAGGTGFAAISNHVLAALDGDEKDDASAAKHLTAAAARNDGVLSEIATLKLAYLKADAASFADLEATVAPLVKAGGPVGALARELVAAKAASTGDVERARRDYQALSLDIDAPQAMQGRVSQALALLPPAPKPTAGATPAASPAATPAPTGVITSKKPQ